MLKSIALQHFRSYKKQEFEFSPKVTLVVGPNTIGKTNIIEAIFLISSGKSFKTDKDVQMLEFGKEVGRVIAKVDDLKLEVVLTNGYVSGAKSQYKKFLVNGVPKRRVDFAANLISVIFSPADLEIIIDSPSLRRNFLDDVLEQTDRDYRVANLSYTKGLRQRNALLDLARETGVRQEKQFEYWDKLVIDNGQILTAKRQEFIDFVNSSTKDIFDLVMDYDKSEISKDRLEQYKSAELGSGVTLVGPHRDDFIVNMSKDKELRDVKYYGSRGQQRLAILQLKSLQIQFIEAKLGQKPLLLLDDIFSELDEGHINLILEKIWNQQTIITTTHMEFVPKKYLKDIKVIELEKL
jgi:DNA replication and repair protein RecF